MSGDEPSRLTNRIQKLRPVVVAMIAAGEMILRPLSVAKELLENALDAGAARIDIEIREAADRFLSVSDDGCGMNEEECSLAIERYATSKIIEEADLDAVATLGFRGEALASIARVARVRIVTSPGGSGGTELRVRGGDVWEVRPAPRARGTSVEVEDLFFNSPVRKRFLRSPTGEIRLIQRLIAAYAICRPEIGFSLTVDGKETITLAPTTPEGRLEQLHGARFREKVLSLSGDHPRIRVRGWVGIPEIARARTQGQTILVNGRWVNHPALGQALRQGYGDLLPSSRYPFAILNLEAASGTVDVNIHPTKREIRFVDDRLVFAEVVRTVRDTLRRLIPGLSSEADKWGASGKIFERGSADGWKPEVSGTRSGEAQPRLDGIDLLYRPSDEAPLVPPSSSQVARDAEQGESEERPEQAVPMVPVWQVQDRYIVAQTRQGLLIIDQHAAHERVLYERALRYLSGDRPTSQQLLFPVVVDLSPAQEEVLSAMGESLGRLGIHIEEFGGRSVVLRSVPATWEGDPAALLRELLDDLSARTKRHQERQQALAASFACHSAIRSGMKLDQESMNRLIDELFSTELPHGDPHGRPTYIVLSVDELDRRFGRSG